MVISEENVAPLKIFLRTHGACGASGMLRAPFFEEKVVGNIASEDNSLNLKIFLPERLLLT